MEATGLEPVTYRQNPFKFRDLVRVVLVNQSKNQSNDRKEATECLPVLNGFGDWFNKLLIL